MDELTYILDQMQDDVEQDGFLAQQIENKRWYLGFLMERAIMPDEVEKNIRIETEGYTLTELIWVIQYVKDFIPKTEVEQFKEVAIKESPVKPSVLRIGKKMWHVKKEYDGPEPRYQIIDANGNKGYFSYSDFNRPWYYSREQLNKKPFEIIFGALKRFDKTKKVKAYFYA